MGISNLYAILDTESKEITWKLLKNYFVFTLLRLQDSLSDI